MAEKGNGTLLSDKELQRAYLDAMLDMMDNPQVWESIKGRSPEAKDAFLFDRFKAAHRAFTQGMSFDDWYEEAKRRGIEPSLAQHVWDRTHWSFRK